MDKGLFKLQFSVFALVTASFANIYITQPILPVLQNEFAVTPVQVSLTVSAVILGIVMSNLFLGFVPDRFPIHPIILVGGICVTAGGVVSGLTHNFVILVSARLFQGIFIPALTTSLAAWLARTLPANRLGVVMGSYVSAGVLGALGGRLLGGWIHPPLHWRYAFFSASGLIVATTVLALLVLPRSPVQGTISRHTDAGFLPLLKRGDLLLVYGCGAAGLLIFSPIFNFLPYRLIDAPFHFSTKLITMIYLVYVLGIFLGPVAGRFSQRHGGGNTLVVGACILGLSLLLLLIPSITAVVLGLLGVCAGFFTIHAVAVGLLNQKLSDNHGKANALYGVFYYGGGWVGITGAGFAFELAGWTGVVGFAVFFTLIPLVAGFREKRCNLTQSPPHPVQSRQPNEKY
jgi:MFS transporter, YNFM family, putative membrane transport protein